MDNNTRNSGSAVRKWLETNRNSIVTFIIGALATVLTFTIDWRKTDIDYGELNLANCQELYQELRTEFNQLKVNNNALQEKLITLEINQAINSQNALVFSNDIDDLPFPYFLKTRDGTMVKLNKAFEAIFLTPQGKSRIHYIDKTDYDIWTKLEANRMRANDKKVLKEKKVMVFKEMVNVNGVIYNVKIFKFPVFLNNSVIGVGGIIVPDEYLIK